MIVETIWILLAGSKRRLLQELAEAGATSPTKAVALTRTLGPIEAAALARLEQQRLVRQASPGKFHLVAPELARFRKRTRDLRLSMVALIIVIALPALIVGISLPQERVPRLVGTVDLTIGSADELRDAYVFSDIRGLALDRRNNIIVADRKDHNVRVYSSAGVHLYTIGRQGQGPGDLLEPCCIALAPNGQLWVKEFGNHRYSGFELGDDRARFLYSIRGAGNPSGYLDRVAWDPQGHLVDITHGIPLATGFLRALLDSTGAARRRDTIPNPSPDSIPSWTHNRCTPQGCGTSLYVQPYGATALRAFGPNGETARAVSSRYAVLWADALGRRIALLQREVEGPPLSDRERGIAERTLDGIARNTGISRGSIPLTVPRRKAPLRAIGFDLDGRLWVERSVPDGAANEADVYDRRGGQVAIMQWPRDVRLSLWAVRGTTGVAVGVDSLGTNRIVRLQFR